MTRQEGPEVVDIECRNAVGQWLVFESCEASEVPEIAMKVAEELTLRTVTPGEHVWLEARERGSEQAGKVRFRVTEALSPSLRWAGPGRFKVLPPRLPRGPLFQDFEGEVIPAEPPREEEVNAW